MQVEISAHTDNVGAESYNQSLLERRAQSVINYPSAQVLIATDSIHLHMVKPARLTATKLQRVGRVIVVWNWLRKVFVALTK